MSYDNNNPFAKILRGELPCINLYEDQQILVMMDIMPQADGHVLVIPKEQAITLPDLSDQSAAACMQAAKRFIKATAAAVGKESATLFQLNGVEAGQTVPHVHFHIIPGSILNAKMHAREVAEMQHLQAIAEKIKAQL